MRNPIVLILVLFGVYILVKGQAVQFLNLALRKNGMTTVGPNQSLNSIIGPTPSVPGLNQTPNIPGSNIPGGQLPGFQNNYQPGSASNPTGGYL